MNEINEQENAQVQRELTMEEVCNNGREAIGKLAKLIKLAKVNSFFGNEQEYPDQHGEMLANLTLAYRHLEDARMRLGKVIQAKDGGASVYDKK